MNFFLQVNELWTDAWWFLGLGLLGIVGYFTLSHFRHRQEQRRAESHDPKAAIVNASNYNISRPGMDEHRTAINTVGEAKRGVEALKSSGELPTREEFARIRRQLKKS
jgi:hypothetical protein